MHPHFSEAALPTNSAEDPILIVMAKLYPERSSRSTCQPKAWERTIGSVFSSGVLNTYRRRAGFQNFGALSGNLRRLCPPYVTNATPGFPQSNSSFGGPPAGICQFVFCDGSVHVVRIGVDNVTLTYLAARQDSHVIPSDY
jgi:hypothetical protein